MDASAGFRLRDTLHAVHAALVLEPGVGALAGDHKDDLLEPADAVLVDRDQLALPAVGLRVEIVHAVELCREQRGFVAARAGADLHHHVFLVVGVFGQQQDLQLLFPLFDPAPGLGKFLLGQFLHLFVALLRKHRERVLRVLFGALIRQIRFHNRL